MVKICCDIVKNKLYLIKSTKLCTITCTKKQKCDNELKKQVQNAIIKAITLPTIMKWRIKMKRTRKITSIILAALMVLSALVVSAGGVSAATSSGSEVYLTTQSTDGRMFMFTHTAQRKMPNGRESL